MFISFAWHGCHASRIHDILSSASVFSLFVCFAKRCWLPFVHSWCGWFKTCAFFDQFSCLACVCHTSEISGIFFVCRCLSLSFSFSVSKRRGEFRLRTRMHTHAAAGFVHWVVIASSALKADGCLFSNLSKGGQDSRLLLPGAQLDQFPCSAKLTNNATVVAFRILRTEKLTLSHW